MAFGPAEAVREDRMKIAVIGSGISGLSAAWLLAERHDVTLFEAAGRPGGHSNTRQVGGIAVDTGFIVYNEATYPNLCALFRHLDVPTKPSEMSFAVSRDGGRLEYAGTDLGGLFAQRGNLVNQRFWSMLRDLLRFYREAPREVAALGSISLDDYLATRRYGTAFREDHLLPMAAAIWSTPAAEIGRYPAAAFIRFCDNHGLLRITGRPVWRTVEGGSRTYVARLTQRLGDRLHLGAPVRRIDRHLDHVEIVDGAGDTQRFDHVVIGTHADQALAMLDRPTPEERHLLGCFAYGRNEAVLHADPRLMPRRRRAWSSWNYISVRERLSLTYWMNRLQGIPETTPLFVTLNPVIEPDPALVHARETYEHPLFNEAAMNAQAALWSLQGRQRSWFCGAYFGSGFHEDGLQAGLAVAEQLGGVRRPWNVAQESSRIQLMPVAPSRIGVPA